MVSITISRAAFHAKDAMPNLGVLPPLALQSQGLPFDRRSVNKRWLAATALVGLGGAAMLGLAFLASVDLSKISTFMPAQVDRKNPYAQFKALLRLICKEVAQ